MASVEYCKKHNKKRDTDLIIDCEECLEEENGMKNRMIQLDDKNAVKIGFTSDKFSPESYLWQNGKKIYISFIHSKEQGKGYFKELIKKIEELGFVVVVPTPLPKMEFILKKYNFKKTYELDSFDERVEVWIK